jgi:hypothetical protein
MISACQFVYQEADCLYSAGPSTLLGLAGFPLLAVRTTQNAGETPTIARTMQRP